MKIVLPLNSHRWAIIWRRVELFIKAIVTPRNKNFWCDSKDWRLCYCCGALRYMVRNQTLFNPKNYTWKVYTRWRFYIVTREDVHSFPINRLFNRPCAELTPRESFK